MSRHEIPAILPNREIVVGWDQPMQTFFGQVHDLSRHEDDQIVHWVGCTPRELYEVEDLERAMSKYAVFSQAIKSSLYGDKDDGL